MVLDTEQHRLLYQLAQAYYNDQLTQQEIAKNFGLSRPKVSRMLKLAREKGIVNITFVPPTGGQTDIDRALKQRFRLDEVVTIPVNNPRNPAQVARDLGSAAAGVLARRVSGSEIISVAWGTTVMALVDALPYKSIPMPNASVVQMCGGLGPIDKLEHSTEIARRMAQKLNARLRVLSAPGVVPDAFSAGALKSVKQISETLEMAAQADIGIVSMGSLSSNSYLVRDGSILTPQDFDTLKKAGAVGDVALHYIGAGGRKLALDINERIIGITHDQLKNIPLVIAVAGGTEKYEIIKAGLLSGIPNIFITDYQTAERLIRDDIRLS